MQQQVRNLRRLLVPLIIITIPVVYYYWRVSLFDVPLLTIPAPLTLLPISSTLPPSTYSVIDIVDRVPSFKLATTDGKIPYADGDRAQATVIQSLKLASRCKEDPSLIVVDVGALLGRHLFSFYTSEIIVLSVWIHWKKHCVCIVWL